MTRQIILTIFILTKLEAMAQDTPSVHTEYTRALLHLTTDERTCDKIKKFKKKWIKDEQTGCEFNISRYIVYLPLPVNLKGLGHEVVNSLKYKEKYYFETEENFVVQNQHKGRSSQLYLLFSKPFENYLAAEFRLNATGNESDMALNANGPVMHILFVFDEAGNVKEEYTSYSYYN